MEFNSEKAIDLSGTNIISVTKYAPPQLSTAEPRSNLMNVREILKKQKDEFECKIRSYSGNDPLENYHNYVIWLEENYFNKGNLAGLVPFLETILTKFKENPDYKQDPRLIEILVKYVSMQENPVELYELVYHQGLGTTCSLFYKSWATEFEKIDDFKEADHVFQLGINCRAQPIKELEEAHVKFQLNIARRMLEGSINVTNNLSGRTPFRKISSSEIQDPFRSQNRADKEMEDLKKYNSPSKPKPERDLIDGRRAAEPENRLSLKPKQSYVSSKSANTRTDPHADRKSRLLDQALPSRARRSEYKCPVAVFEPPDPTKKSMYPKHLVYANGSDMQLEEIRASHYLNYRKDSIAQEAIKEPLDLTKSSNASSDSCQVMARHSSVTNSQLKQTYTDLNLIDRVTNAEMSAYDHSWYLRTEFIQPIKLTHVTEPKIMQVYRELSTRDHNDSCLTTDFIQPVRFVETINPSTVRNFHSESHLSAEPASLKRKSETTETKQEIVAHRTQNKLHQRFEDEMFNFSNHLLKGNISAFHHSPSTSFTVNTRTAINVIQKMWESPLAPRSAKISKSNDDFTSDVFKMPVAQSSQFFEPPNKPDSLSNFNQWQYRSESQPCMSEDGRLSEEPLKSANKLTFPVYCENENPKTQEIDIYARLSCRKATRRNSNMNPDPSELISSSMSSLNIREEHDKEKQSNRVPLIVPVKLEETPRGLENKENDPPVRIVIPCGIEDANSESDEEKNELLDDDTCSTRAFAVLLPSSTPFSRPDRSQRARKSSAFNGSYTEEDIAATAPVEPKSSVHRLNASTMAKPVNLSLILENSKEHGHSSTSANVPKPVL